MLHVTIAHKANWFHENSVSLMAEKQIAIYWGSKPMCWGLTISQWFTKLFISDHDTQ